MHKLFLTTLLILGTPALTAQVLPYQNPQLTAEQRADDLIGRLKLDEKVKLMMDSSPAIERLGIPQFQWWNEALHGVARNGFATVFPITTMMASTWDDGLVYHVFSAASDEARVKAQQAKKRGKIQRYQGLSFWTPNINIYRDPRWGRGQETYGEDPYLTERMGLAVVNGLQGQPYDNSKPSLLRTPKYKKLLACAKHFAVHSGPEWNRHSFDVQQLPARDLWETYLPAFKAVVQKGNVAEVMCAYQSIDGQPCCGNARFERQILRDEWGFKGLITSDCWAIRDFLPELHNVSKDLAAASAKAVGEISEKQIDISLKRLLVARFELGDFDKDELVEWTKIPSSVIASKKHKQLALQAAREGVVLLKNNGVLPLSSISHQTSDIVVMGPNANDSIMQWGNYCGSATKTITVLEGLRKQLGNIRYIQGCAVTKSEILESRFDHLRSPKGQKGMQAIYWNNTTMKGNPATTVHMSEPINLSNGGGTVFAPGVQHENFSARYNATFIPTEDETLYLRVAAEDKVRVLVNGDTLVNLWTVRQRIQEATPELKVKKGTNYRIEIDYVQEHGLAALHFDICKKTTPTSQQLLSQIGNAKTVVFVGGISPRFEGEEMKVNEPGFKGGDRTDIELPKVQRDMLHMLHQAGKKVVFVNCSGGAMAMVPELQSCDAIVQGWYPGEQGGQAIAEVLTGQVNPSGKLPLTFYRSVKDLPDFMDYTMKNRTYRYFKGEALFPFGYGLSYTTFEIGKPQFLPLTNTYKVRAQVRNTGKVEGTEVVQVYIRHTADKGGPLKTLRGYQRITLKPGEAKTVTIELPRERFETWDPKTNSMRVLPGQYELMMGSSSADKDLKKIVVTVK